jgi:hypothetical protein
MNKIKNFAATEINDISLLQQQNNSKDKATTKTKRGHFYKTQKGTFL